ncbi:MAG: tetratricopeptide repeat protein [Planctomycetia bacterium]|nr:tetratricopeptide repeat protein [Planctomycetia bacterium]
MDLFDVRQVGRVRARTVRLLFLLSLLICVASARAQDAPDKAADKTPTKAAEAKEAPPQLDAPGVYRRTLKSTAWSRHPVAGGGISEGTAWVLDAEKGLLVTNEHVVAGVDEVDVFFPVAKDGKTVLDQAFYLNEVKPLVGRVIDRDTKVDLALVKVDAVPKDVIALPLAAESPEPGQRVFTLGSQPQGSEGMWIFTTGEVRQVYRRSHARGHVARMVETQLPTNPGNSGGAVVNDRAEVVAVVEGAATDARLVSVFVDIHELRDYLKQSVPLADPKTANDYNTRGTRRHDEGRHDAAIADYTESLRLNPEQPIVLTNRGWAFYANEDYDAALADFEEALGKDREFGSAYEGRGTTYREMGKYDQAIKDLTHAIRLDPNDPGLYQRRATAYELDSQLKNALADRNRAVQRDDSNFDYHYQRGQTLRKLRQFDEALEDFQRAASLAPASAAVCYEIGYVYQDRKDYAQAVFFYDLAIKRDDTIASFYNNRGLCKTELKEYPGAAQDFLKAIELRPDHAPYHRRLGIVFHEAGQDEIALKHFNKAAELDPVDTDTYHWRAKSHDALGNKDEAAADRKKAKE